MNKHIDTSGISCYLKISRVIALLLTLGACNSGGGGGNTPSTSDNGSASNSGGGDSGSTQGTGGGANSGSSSSDPATSGEPGTADTSTLRYLAADDGVHGIELWKTDGTADGTVLVKDINTAAGGSSPRGFTEFNGARYFQAYDSVNGVELWKTDGTAEGTVLVKKINATPGIGSSPDNFTVLNGVLYFKADDGVHGYELWKTDGTDEGTQLVKDINTTPGADALNRFNDFTVFNGAIYFQADDGMHGTELWKTDGTAAGTMMVKDINITTNNSGNSMPAEFTEFNGALYFRAYDGVHGYELWKTDGTESGTVMAKDIFPVGSEPGPSSTPGGFKVFNGALYFVANDGVHADGSELWKTDGTDAGTVMVKNINIYGGSSYPFGFTVFNSALYFSADDGAKGRELWKTDGTEAGTLMVKDIFPGNGISSSSDPGGFTELNGVLYFQASDGASPAELWKTDGTAVGTTLVTAIPNAIGKDAAPAFFNVFNNALYFTTRDGVHGYEFWKTDGTAEGTQILKDICPGACDGPMSYSGLH